MEFARAVIAWGLAGHQSASSEQLKDYFCCCCGMVWVFFNQQLIFLVLFSFVSFTY